MSNIIQLDKKRRKGDKIPAFQYCYRKCEISRFKIFWKFCLSLTSFMNKVELSAGVKIGEGLYIGHPYCITINPKTIIGKNCNIHKGVTIGQENRGNRKGTPVIGNCVWIGVNATIVGAITIGDDVLIAPNTYINCDIPSHSVVFGNPCIIKHRENATEYYINNKV